MTAIVVVLKLQQLAVTSDKMLLHLRSNSIIQ